MGVGKTVHGGMQRCVLHGGGEQRVGPQDTRGSHTLGGDNNGSEWTALSNGSHCCEGGGGRQGLGRHHRHAEKNNNQLMMMISCLGVGQGRNLRSLPHPLPPPIVARSAQTMSLTPTYPRRQLQMSSQRRTAPTVRPRSTAEQPHVDC